MFYLVDDFGGLFVGSGSSDPVRLVREFPEVALTDVAVSPSDIEVNEGSIDENFIGRVLLIDSDTLYEFDTEALELVEGPGLTLDGEPFTGAEGFEFAAGAWWIAGSETTGLYTVDVETGEMTLVGDTGVSAEGDVVFAADLVWISTTDETFVAVDPADASPQVTVDHGILGLEGVTVVDGTVTGFAENLVYEFDADALEFNFAGDLAVDPQTEFLNTTGAGQIPGAGETVSTEDAQTIALLFEAALDRDGDIDVAGLNFWINQRQILSIEEISQAFLESPEFEMVVGSPVDDLSDMELVEALYENILDRPGETAGVEFWTDVVSNNEDFSRADLLTAFAIAPENIINSPEAVSVTEVVGETWNLIA
ncbi:MAG: DUF4214 domain-containing protein [Pikeienuella sp.]